MRKLLTFLVALGAIVFGVCSPAFAVPPFDSFPPGTFQNRAAIDAPSALPGPPTATFQSQVAITPSGSTLPATVATGTSFPTRIVVAVIVGYVNGSAFTISGATLDGNAALTFGTVISGPGSGADAGVWWAVFADSAATTTSSFVATMSATTTGGTFRVATYTMDSTTLLSTTPTPFSASASSSATSNTLNLTVPNSGSVLIAQDSGNNVTKTYSGSPTMTSDAAFNQTKLAHANNVAAGSPSLTINWTPASVAEVFGALLFR